MPKRRRVGITLAAVVAACSTAPSAPAATLLRVDTFGAKGSAPGKLSYPAGIAVARDGTVYVADTLNARVQAFDPGGAPLRVIGSAGRQDGQFGAPQGIGVARDGSLWVADNGRDRIQHFAAVGSLLSAFGSSCQAGAGLQGPCEGGFSGPEGVALGKDGSIYVADTRNSRVQRLTPDGTFRAVSTAPLSLPEDAAVTRDGSVLVTDTGHGHDRLVRLSADLARTQATIALPGGWRQPVGMTVAPDGCAYFLDWNVGRVGVLSGNSFAGEAAGHGVLSQPQALAAGPDSSLYVADSNHNRVVRFDDPTPQAAAGGTPAAGVHAPVLSALSISRTLRATALRGCAASPASAGSITYRLSTPALVTFAIRSNGRTVGRFIQYGGRGTNIKRWAAAIGSRRLRAGRYVLEAAARNRAGTSRLLRDGFIVGG